MDLSKRGATLTMLTTTKHVVFLAALFTATLLLTQRMLHTANDSWSAHKVNHDLVVITCTKDKTPVIVESATEDAILVSCDLVQSTKEEKEKE
jgi:hypothetical protein